MAKLPPGWALTSIGVGTEITSGIGFPKQYQGLNTGDVGFFKVGDISRAVLKNQGELRNAAHYISFAMAEQLRGRPIPAGATVFAKIGEAISLNRRAVVAHECLVDNNVMSVKAFPPILDRYLFQYMRTVDLTNLSRATTIPSLRKSDIESIQLPLAPLAEQKRITDKLDVLLPRIDACRERLDRVPALLKRFRQSVLASAASGELTREWRKSNPFDTDAAPLARAIEAAHTEAGGYRPGNAATPTDGVHNLTRDMFPKTWSLLALRDLVRPDRPITYGILKPGPELKEGVPYVRVADFPNDRLNLESIRKTSPAIDAEFKRSRLQTTDLLLSIRGTVGRLVVTPAQLEGANITQDTARLSIQPAMNFSYVLWILRSDLLQQRMKAAVKGVAVQGINIGDVRALQIPLPSRAEQDEIVTRVETLLSYCDGLLAKVNTARARAGNITSSALAKAFRGELVPQDPNDEPAFQLLARLKAQRSAIAAEPRLKQVWNKRPAMSDTQKDAIRTVILKLKVDMFSFDELRSQVAGDYESIKDALFELLGEPNPVVRQVFDKKEKAMQLVRVRL